MTQSIKLKSRLKENKILSAPGIYDALSALLAEQAGFESVFLSGSALAYSQLGRPDIGLITMNEVVDACARVTDRIQIPVLVDVDSGFGNAVHATRTIRVLEQAGAAAIQIEDQLPINPANDLKGRPLVSAEVMADKIRALVDSRRSTTLISARTDSPFSEPLSATVDRVGLYREAGADVLFAEGLKTVEDMKAIVEVADGVPVVYNLLHADGDFRSAQQLEDIGVSIALFPGDAILSSVAAMKSALIQLKADQALAPDSPTKMTPKELNGLLGTPEIIDRYKDFAG